MFRRTSLTLVGAITLLLLAVAPVYAAPSLSLGSSASYNLTGKNGITLPIMLVTKMPSRGFVLMSWLRLSMRSVIEGHGSFASG